MKDNPYWDPSAGIILTPSYHGNECARNGEHGECCCDECDYMMECFPDWQTWAQYNPFTGEGTPL